jgi:DNA-binding NarL/FixJ family response regulator
LTSGVENLLIRQNGMNIMSTALSDWATLANEIERFHPDVLIFDTSLRFTDLTSLLDLLKDTPELRVVVMNVHDNRVHVYDKREIIIKHASDLVAAI